MTDFQIYAFYRAKERTELAAIAARYGNHCGAYYHMQTVDLYNRHINLRNE
jgi:hypothetical protein